MYTYVQRVPALWRVLYILSNILLPFCMYDYLRSCLASVHFEDWHATCTCNCQVIYKLGYDVSDVKMWFKQAHTHTHTLTHTPPHPTQTWRDLEAQLFELNVAIPVYFAIEDSELKEIHSNLILAAKKEKTATAVEGKGGGEGGWP